MIQEYAVEPTTLASWDRFRMLIFQFGFQHGRLLSRYPKKWKRLVYESLSGCKDVERTRIEEALRHIDNRMMRRPNSSFDDKNTWLQNATNEHAKKPFHAIIAESNPGDHPRIIVEALMDPSLDPDSLREEDPRRLWEATRAQTFKRTAADLASITEPWLVKANKIHFVDPFFGPENSRHKNVFAAFMKEIAKRSPETMPEVVTFHCEQKSSLVFFQTNSTKLAPFIPGGLSVEFRRWKPRELHNRYVLTDVGALILGEGIGEATPDSRSEDTVAILDKEVADYLIAQLTPGSDTCFELIDTFSVTGEMSITDTPSQDQATPTD